MLRERFGNESEMLFSITGVDIDSTVISAAKQGVYGKSSFRGMDQALFERYFEPYAPDKFRVKDTIRKHAEFDIVNLLGSAYPQSMHMPDVILYRNVSIYFPGHIQRKIFGKLAELLADGGCLMVGASETIHHDIGLLSLVKQDSLFFYHKPPTLVFEERRKLGRHPMFSERPSTRTLPATPLFGGSTATHQIRTHAGHVHDPSHKHPQFRQPDVKGLFDTAIELAHTKKYDEALAALDIIIDQDNTFEKAHCLKGSLLLNTARFDESRTVCEAVLAHNPLCLAACLMLGITARHNGDIEGAFRRFRDAIYLDPSCWLAHFYSAEILFAQREDKRARSGFEAALKILVNGQMKDHGQAFFPLSFNAEQFTVICRHKLSLLKEN
jgi:chemotaxis protein methyltransferase CheR